MSINKQGIWKQSGKVKTNLVKGTNTSSLDTNAFRFTMQTGACTYSIENDTNEIPCLKAVRNDTEYSGWIYMSYNRLDVPKIKTSTTYTVSFDIKSTGAGVISLAGFIVGNATNRMSATSSIISNTITPNKWCRMVYTTTTLDSFDEITVGNQVVYFNVSGSGLTSVGTEILIKNFKVEEGTVPTTWSPHVNDDGYIDETGCFIQKDGKALISAADYLQANDFIEI